MPLSLPETLLEQLTVAPDLTGLEIFADSLREAGDEDSEAFVRWAVGNVGTPDTAVEHVRAALVALCEKCNAGSKQKECSRCDGTGRVIGPRLCGFGVVHCHGCS